MLARLSVIAGLALWVLIPSCAAEGVWPVVDGDLDGDADIDGDSDGDGDGGPGGDADGDGDIDRNVGAAPEPWVGQCLDGVLDDDFGDCENLECLDAPGCCHERTGLLREADFASCVTPADCGWTGFPADDSGVSMVDGWAVLSGVSTGAETGIYTGPVVEPRGELFLTFSAALGETDCSETSCRQALGVALTPQEIITGGTGVDPALAIVLDGELGVAHFIVSGRSLHTVAADLTSLQGFAMRVDAEGNVAFWAGLEADATDGAVAFDGSSVYEAARGLAGSGRLRLSIFGRFSETGGGRVGGLTLDNGVCDIPDGFGPGVSTPVTTGDGTPIYAGRPAVVRRPFDEGLLMVFEHGSGLAVATSADGRSWTREPAFVLERDSDNAYGAAAQRAPSVVFFGEDSHMPGYHLWYVGESQHSGLLAGDEPRNAILHAVSTDGMHWRRDPDAPELAVIGSPDHAWRAEVDQPSVAVRADGSLVMFFVGRDAATGRTRIGRATSLDGKEWTVDDAPIMLGHDEPPAFERDGIAFPTVVPRGEVLHLWYAGVNGSRSSIGYAVGERDGSRWVWQRFGNVFEASQSWEAQRIIAASVVTLPHPGHAANADTAMLHMWYQAGAPGRERLGLTTRELPAQLVARD